MDIYKTLEVKPNRQTGLGEIFAQKSPIVDVRLGSKYASDHDGLNHFRRNIQLNLNQCLNALKLHASNKI